MVMEEKLKELKKKLLKAKKFKFIRNGAVNGVICK